MSNTKGALVMETQNENGSKDEKWIEKRPREIKVFNT